jgi:beta-mannosidase
MIDLAIGANFNMLRLWGGAIINKDFFYEYCDEKGIMVWQEFPLACNNYFDSREYLAVLESEAEAIVNRLKKHSCIIIWCGGNELFNSWSGMTDQSLAIRLLNKITFENDPNTPFIPTSPIMGMGHGYYLFRNDKTSEDVFEIYNDLRFSALTEFGVPSASTVEVIEEIIPKEELWPPKKKGSWMEHHAFYAWDVEKDSWLNLKTIERYFGVQENLEVLVENSQFLQAVGLKYIYEEARRQQPYCSMASNWCFNDCWPSAANTSIICYPNIPKKAYDGVRAACRPKIASARIEKFEWSHGEEFIAELFILNDSLSIIDQGSISVFLITEKDKLKIHSWKYPKVGSQQNIEGPKINYMMPDLDTKRFSLSLENEENHQLNSEYFLLFKKAY